MLKKLFITLLIALGFALPGVAAERGTRDEAVAMVQDAQAHIAEVGLDEALKTFNDVNETRFHQKDLYVFAVDGSNVHIALGAKPQLVGKSFYDMADPNGVYPGREMRQVADGDGKGWVDYSWTNPMTGKIDGKTAYVEAIPGADGAYVGVGVYAE